MESTMTPGAAVGLGLGILVLIWIASGLIVGALARWALPGPDQMGLLPTFGYGVGGSFLGGIVARATGGPAWLGFALSVAGAALLIWFFRRRGKPSA